jgi:hypothetical protein
MDWRHGRYSVFFISVHAEEWETLWIQAIEACDENDFLCGEKYFDEQ